jgi:radical SAM protein with 4Fe4S-binding SPASM domain
MTTLLRKTTRRLATVLRRESSYLSPRPIEINLELTHRCNLRCRMCGVWGKKNDRQLPELTPDEYNNLFGQMKDLGVHLVTLAGGEPFMRADLFDIIAAAKAKGLICNLFSNGTMIDRVKIGRIFESRLDKIIISVDGIGPVHDAVRGIPGSFDRAMRALAGMAAERRLRGADRPEIDMHMTLVKDNVLSLSPLHRVSQELGINFSFQPYSETTEGAVGQTRLNGHSIGSVRYLPKQESLRFTDEQVLQIRDEISRLPASFYTKLLSSLGSEQLQKGLMPIRKCYITRSFMMIDPYGHVYPCTNLDGHVVGSVRDRSLSSIWKGEKYAALRKSLSRRLLPICAYCCHCADNLTPGQLATIILRPNSTEWSSRNRAAPVADSKTPGSPEPHA